MHATNLCQHDSTVTCGIIINLSFKPCSMLSPSSRPPRHNGCLCKNMPANLNLYRNLPVKPILSYRFTFCVYHKFYRTSDQTETLLCCEIVAMYSLQSKFLLYFNKSVLIITMLPYTALYCNKLYCIMTTLLY